MAGYFAELKNNIVQRVVSATDKEWCENNLGGEWVQTYYDTQGKNYAGIGYIYYPEKENFSCSQPFNSWLLGEDCKWYPPKTKPEDNKHYTWNEEILDWEETTPIWQQ